MRTTLKKVQKLVMNVHTSQKLVLQTCVQCSYIPLAICTFTTSCWRNHDTFQDFNYSHITKWFWECPIHLDTIINGHVPKKNSNWSIQIIGKPPLIGKNNVWKHESKGKDQLSAMLWWRSQKMETNAYSIN
jgi:hypothetical protein